jgi:hypothetical protein
MEVKKLMAVIMAKDLLDAENKLKLKFQQQKG